MSKYVPFLIFIMFISQGCIMGQNKAGMWENGKIDPKVMAAITALDTQAYNSMCDNNFERLSQLFSDTLRSTISDDFSKKFMPGMQHVMKGKKYKVFDQFYIRTAKATDTIQLASGKGDLAWTMKFPGIATQTFVSMLVAGDSVNEVMLTLIYGNVKGKWQISNVLGEDYALNKRNAIEQYKYSMSLEQNRHLIDALDAMALAEDCALPGGRNFRFAKAKEMKAFSDTLAKEVKAKYLIPYKINEVSSKPIVINIHNEVFEGSFIPMIIYQSSVSVFDTVALKKENDEVQEKIGIIFPGVDKNNTSVIYRAYNELPNGQNDPRYYGFIQRFKHG